MRARLRIRVRRERLRRGGAFTVSGAIHSGLLLWLAAATALQQHAPRKTIYEQEIKPNLSRLVWYDFKQALPDVRPTASGGDERPARARLRAKQSVVAGKREDTAAPQMIWMAAPQVELPKALKLPNVLAVATPRPVREFKTPEKKETTGQAKPPVLPEAPKLSADGGAAKVDLGAAMPRPEHKAFTAPAAPRRVEAKVELAAAPEVPAPLVSNAVPLEVPKVRPVRSFVAPEQPSAVQERPALPEAAGVKPPAPAVSLAIVGLTPAKTLEPPKPPGAHDGGFSAGPEPRPDGGAGAGASAGVLVVPGLMIGGTGKSGVPALPSIATALAGVGHTGPRPAAAARVSNSPDPRMDGRAIYTLAIQMANVTSYSGSWLVWFAEHSAAADGTAVSPLRPPSPLRKVDPKYVVTAMEERVEGIVRLAATVRTDGHVEGIEVIKHLDDRLDRSAAEALGKWVFEPAQRDGAPVEIDAVFEIPFRLAPKPKR